MNEDDEKILKVAKEVLVKFIEMGTVSPTNFDEKFRSVYWTIKDTVLSARLTDLEVSSPSEEKAPEK
jgi:16S rRNA C1402 N4-methylase RsmH